jgi:hypothetical protein
MVNDDEDGCSFLFGVSSSGVLYIECAAHRTLGEALPSSCLNEFNRRIKVVLQPRVKEVNVAELRRRLGIKKLKKKMVVTEADRTALKEMREHDKERAS